ncbi:MAG: TIGR04552 family protein [Pseudomonadota bacterium]
MKRLEDFTLQDIEAIRLILTGGSVIDWYRLNLTDVARARRFVENHELYLDLPGDRAFIQQVQREAVSYLRRHFNFKIPKPVENAAIEDLLQMASGKGHRQVCACTILKVVQIINHMAGRELLFRLPVSDRDLFHLVEEKVYRIVGTMLSEGFPITEFIGGRKNLDSTYTKLLSRPEATAAALYDKLRFRIVTRTREDVLPVLLYLTEQLFPFNYVVPKQSTNTIFDLRQLFEKYPNWASVRDKLQWRVDGSMAPTDNRFTAPSYRVVQFVTEVPVRVPPHLMELAPAGSESLGPIVYVLCEFQILDVESEAINETGDASHDRYKQRQRAAVFRRLRSGPKCPTS